MSLPMIKVVDCITNERIDLEDLTQTALASLYAECAELQIRVAMKLEEEEDV